MRSLSRRLRHLQHAPCIALRAHAASQLRASSRYSQPAKRASNELPISPASFVANTATIDTFNDASASVTNPLFDRSQGERATRSARNAYYRRRARFAAYGLALSLGGLAVAIYAVSDVDEKKGHSLDASKDSNASFQGRDVKIIGVGEGKRIVAEDIELVETGTSSVPHFPKTIYLPTAAESSLDPNALTAPNTDGNPGNKANLEEYTLVGLGIRSVSFLSIQVYVAGMYVKTTDITGLQARLIHHINPAASTLIPSEKEDLRKSLLDAEGSRKIWDGILQVPGIKTAWRIVPTRNTDFMHLRDGWITGINKRTAEAKKLSGNVPSEYDREDFGISIKSFMSIFKGGKAPKGSIMILSRTNNGELDVFFTPKPEASGAEKGTELLGSISDERISKLIWMNYLAGDKVSSEAARQGVADGCVAMASRPVGSVETMVA
ncbi:hypothetical protein AMS68_001166 [Peltaster fructicola]|uniref:Chalcone isomerase domain-containing protein n=1 Tax=Peltaster fructicola TaxID=286661 RepID=A0A6H0XLZ3_9PEZI|nr:hypothetical protein AMS68_001166 [Peltaster fructicola]